MKQSKPALIVLVVDSKRPTETENLAKFVTGELIPLFITGGPRSSPRRAAELGSLVSPNGIFASLAPAGYPAQNGLNRNLGDHDSHLQSFTTLQDVRLAA